jgi:hypothetical protein
MGDLTTGDDRATGNRVSSKSRDVLPLLPLGTPLFQSLPSRAIVIDALAPAVGDGIVTSRRPTAAGVAVIRGGAIAECYCIDDGQTVAGDEALQRISAWDDALVSASRLSVAEVNLVPQLFRGVPLYDDLHLGWVDWAGFLADLRRRPGAFVVELNTPAGRGVTSIQAGAHVASYTDRQPGLGDPTMLDELAQSGQGSIRVRHVQASDALPVAEPAAALIPADVQPAALSPAPDPVPEDVARFSESFGLRHPAGPAAQPAAAPTPESAPAPSDFGALLPDLKLLVRSRLQMASPRVEILLEDAALAGSPLECVALQVRGTTLRGVQQSTMERLADDLLTLAGQQAR